MSLNLNVELIGPARLAYDRLLRKLQRFKEGRELDNDPLLLWGPPGTGKTTVALKLAKACATYSSHLDHINGQDLSVDLVRQWQFSSHYRPFEGWCMVKLVD